MKIGIAILVTCLVFSSCDRFSPSKKDILETFLEVEVDTAATVRSPSDRSKDLVNKIGKKTGKTSSVYQSALIANRTTKTFICFLDSLYNVVIEASQTKSNNDIANHNKILIEGGKGKELKIRINNTRRTLLSLLSESDKGRVKTDLIANDPSENLTWEKKLLQNAPPAAVVTIFKKIENDVHHTNLQVLQLLLDNKSTD